MTNHDRRPGDDAEIQGLPTMSLAEPRTPTESHQPSRRDDSGGLGAGLAERGDGAYLEESTAAPAAAPNSPGQSSEAAASLDQQTDVSRSTAVGPAAGHAEDPPSPRDHGVTDPDAPQSSSAAQPSSEPSLFGGVELAGLRERWTSVQSCFVDDPRDCLQQADGLVSDVVGHLTAGFTAARSRLEEHWGRGEEASTEDLRLALTRYRDFFERLLAV